MRLTSLNFNERSWCARTRSLVFAIPLSLAYITICSTYAHSYYDHNLSHEYPWSPDTPTNIEHEFTVAGAVGNTARILGREIEKAPLHVPDPHVPHDRPDLDTPHNVTPILGDELHARAYVTAETINKLADFVGNDALLTGILDEIGYSPPHAEWKRLSTVIKLRLAHDAAELASPGGGNDLFGSIVHRLRDIYEGVGDDPLLKGFLAIPPKQSIKFAERKLSSPFSILLPTIVTETINAIAKYFDGGMQEILEGYFGVKDPFEILISSTSNSEALGIAFNRLAPADGHAALKKIIIERVGWKYESAAKSDIFSTFMALQLPEYRNPGEIAEFRSSIRTRVDAQLPGVLRQPAVPRLYLKAEPRVGDR